MSLSLLLSLLHPFLTSLLLRLHQSPQWLLFLLPLQQHPRQLLQLQSRQKLSQPQPPLSPLRRTMSTISMLAMRIRWTAQTRWMTMHRWLLLLIPFLLRPLLSLFRANKAPLTHRRHLNMTPLQLPQLLFPLLLLLLLLPVLLLHHP